MQPDAPPRLAGDTLIHRPIRDQSAPAGLMGLSGALGPWDARASTCRGGASAIAHRASNAEQRGATRSFR
eukprot:6332165-Prymnesium_polylepis.1